MKKPLVETNPYLRDPKTYRETLLANVASSTAIETGQSTDEVKKQIAHLITGRRPDENAPDGAKRERKGR